jgi:hypothetical protein
VTLARPSGPSLPHSPAKTAARCWSRPSAAREPTRSPRCLPPSRTCPTSSGTARSTTPYFAFLALADAIVAMEDSVNMVTEAAGTGKPVYVQALKGSSRHLARFHALMQGRGATRPLKAGSRAGPTPRSTTPRWSPLPSGARFTLKLKPNSPRSRSDLRALLALSPA